MTTKTKTKNKTTKKTITKKSDLTLKQRKFLNIFIKSGNASEAALLAGYKHRESGYENLSKPLVQKAFHEMLDDVGLGDDADLEDLKRHRFAQKVISCNVLIKSDGSVEMPGADGSTNDFIEVDDFPAQQKNLETRLRLKGRLSNSNTTNIKIENKTLFQDIQIGKLQGDELWKEINKRLSCKV